MHSKLIFLLFIFFFILPIVTMAIPVPHEDDSQGYARRSKSEDGDQDGDQVTSNERRSHGEKNGPVGVVGLGTDKNNLPVASHQNEKNSQEMVANQQQSKENYGTLSGANTNVQPSTKFNACNNQVGVGVVGVPIGNECET
ncbi:hypothetical protein F8M41_019004 [Gigaspora margarita]|uniref:Uncharacterized protein n=1 Tax=Gigaspora margarita TaxID=4874 RepID=A0A8H4B2B4_GIGMA|nr:hypothetical protein F8M41_019004 [Gigaspora margarita]